MPTDETKTDTVESAGETPVAAPVEAPVEAPSESSSPEAETPTEFVATPPVLTTAGKTKGVCDIVFLMDAIGSMQPAIDDLKKNIKLFFKKLSDGDANGNSVVKDWRARVIAYRAVDSIFL